MTTHPTTEPTIDPISDLTTESTRAEPTAAGTRFSGTFILDSWDQQDDAPRDGSVLSHVRLAKTLSGDLVGTSTADLLLIGTDSGSRAYCGFERLTGAVAGRTGSFMLRHAAEGDAAGGWMTWQVMIGSGTDELTGVRGEGQIVRHEDGGHSYTLDLSFT